jgi:putative endonuclease
MGARAHRYRDLVLGSARYGGGNRPAVTGRRGEHLAAVHLGRRGYEILARNARTPAGEIDLIARRGGVIVFVEVKTRRLARADGLHDRPEPDPLASLRSRQRARLRRAAAAWLRSERRKPAAGGAVRGRAATIRFDAIGVVLDTRGNLKRLDHVEGAW